MQRHDRIELYELEALKKYKAQQPKWSSSSSSNKKDSTVGMQLLSAQESHRAVLAQHPTSIPVGTIRLGRIDDDNSSSDEMTTSSSSSPLQASLLSPNGKFLAVSNATSTYVFHLKQVAGKTKHDDGSVRLQPTKIELPAKLQNVSATTFLFVGDDLYVGDSSGHQQEVHVMRLGAAAANTADKKQKEEDRMDLDGDDDDNNISEEISIQTVSLPGSQHLNNGQVALPIQSIHASVNYGEFMVTVSHARDNAVHIFRRRENDAPYEHYWTLPSLGGGTDARPAAVTVLDGNRLAVATYRSHLYIFDIETKSLNKWSEQYGFPIKDKKWTEDSLCGRGYPLRLIPQQNGRLIMVRIRFVCHFYY